VRPQNCDGKNLDTPLSTAHGQRPCVKATYESSRFVEQTFIPRGGAANATTYDPWNNVSQAWANGLSSWAFVFGGDTVTEALVIPEEIRLKLASDYGRSRGLAWYALVGFGLVHTDALNSRIYKWDSAT
jgi:hypothetical protein